jgi:CTP:molybdopterin cytidylyltransferase MocA
MIGGMVLAAGFGGGKLLARLDGRPLIEYALAAMAGARSVEHTVVVLGYGADEIRAAVRLHGAEPVLCTEWQEGQAASLRAGLSALIAAGPEAAPLEAVVVTLGDQPRVDARAIETVVGARLAGDPAPAALRASYGGRPGHPVLLERELFGAVASLRGDIGARDLLRGARVRDVPCDGLGCPDDVDTPAQLEVLNR